MNNCENKNVLDCEIVRDLLSLYHDEVVSDTTRTAVKSHLEGCEACRGEYDTLCDELPVDSVQKSTGKSFFSMMRRQKTKRIFTVIGAVLLACVLLIGGYFAQLTLAVASFNDEVTMVQAYKFETEEGDKFFLMFDRPMYDGALHYRFEPQTTENGNVLVINFKKSLFGITFDENIVETIIYDCSYEAEFNDMPELAGISEVRIGDRVVWSEVENGDDPIPEYVYEYGRNDSEFISSWQVTYDAENPQLNCVSASYADGRNVFWDFDGNVVTEYMSQPDTEPTIEP